MSGGMSFPRPRIRSWSTVLALFLFLMGPVLFPGAGGSAQEVEEEVAELEYEYSSARSTHQAALDARSAAERRFSRALQEIDDARSAGDQDRLERAYATAQVQAVTLQTQDQRVLETIRRLEEARRNLLESLDAFLDRLAVELQEASGDPERRDLAFLIRDLSERMRELEGEGRLAEEARLVALPELTFDPRDGPQEMRWKAELLERRARQYEQRLDEIDRQITELERRQSRDRQVRDMMAGIERFDDSQLPVGTGPQGDALSLGEEESDSSPDEGESGAPLTLEERIDRLRVLRDQIESYRDQVIHRAQLFRERGTGGIS